MVGTGAGAGFTGKRRQKFGELQAHAADDFLAANAFGQDVHVGTLAGGKDHGALDNIFEFADVAWPVVVHEQLQRGRRELQGRLGVFLAITLDEVGEQERHVFAAIAERGKLEMNNVEAVKEIFAEAAFANQG